MPLIREQKYPAEILAKYAELGTCVSPGMEIWYMRGKRLQVGVIQAIREGKDISVIRTDGVPVIINPMERVLFVKAPSALNTKS